MVQRAIRNYIVRKQLRGSFGSSDAAAPAAAGAAPAAAPSANRRRSIGGKSIVDAPAAAVPAAAPASSNVTAIPFLTFRSDTTHRSHIFDEPAPILYVSPNNPGAAEIGQLLQSAMHGLCIVSDPPMDSASTAEAKMLLARRPSISRQASTLAPSKAKVTKPMSAASRKRLRRYESAASESPNRRGRGSDDEGHGGLDKATHMV